MLTADAFGVLPPISRLSRRAGDVPFPVRLHRAPRRHRARRHRAAGDLLDLLRRAVHAAPPERLRRDAGRADPAPRRALLAAQHGLDRRRLRHRAADADRAPRAPCSDAALGRAAGRRADGRASGVRPARCPAPAPRWSRALLDPRSTWADGRPTTLRRGGWPGGSRRISQRFAPFVGTAVQAAGIRAAA